MQMGFNNDVAYRDLTVHIQTEDHGLGSMKITSQVFFSGAIVDSKTISYAAEVADLDDEKRDERIRLLMKAIHRKFYKRIHEGVYDEKLPLGGAPPPVAHLNVRSVTSDAAIAVPTDLLASAGFSVAGEQAELGDAYEANSRGERLSQASLAAAVSGDFEQVVDHLAGAATREGSGFVQLGGVGTGSHLAVTSVPQAPPASIPRRRRDDGDAAAAAASSSAPAPAAAAAPSAVRPTVAPSAPAAYRGYDPSADDGFGALLLVALESA